MARRRRRRELRHQDLTIGLITDEVSPSLDEGLAFARDEGIGTIDLRVIDGRNVLALSRGELADAARRVRAQDCRYPASARRS